MWKDHPVYLAADRAEECAVAGEPDTYILDPSLVKDPNPSRGTSYPVPFPRFFGMGARRCRLWWSTVYWSPASCWSSFSGLGRNTSLIGRSSHSSFRIPCTQPDLPWMALGGRPRRWSVSGWARPMARKACLPGMRRWRWSGGTTRRGSSVPASSASSFSSGSVKGCWRIPPGSLGGLECPRHSQAGRWASPWFSASPGIRRQVRPARTSFPTPSAPFRCPPLEMHR